VNDDAPNSWRADPHVADEMHSAPAVEEIDRLRAHEYGLLAHLLARPPSREFLDGLSRLQGDASLLGQAHARLAEAAAVADPDAVEREYFALFIGVGRGELLPYASYYLTGFLHEKPLSRVREDLALLRIERAEHQSEPEDHLMILCEVMAGLAGGRFAAERGAERRFFERHLKPFAARCFGDLEMAHPARFYRAVGTVGRLFMNIEVEAEA
jgi:TorA maturation chaperone TorD